MTLPITVIIPTYCRPELTAQALLSVYHQTQPPREILILDDASGQDFATLRALCAEVKARFSQLPILLHIKTLARHLGMPGAVRNVAMLWASQSWLAFLDSDDVWLPQKLQKQWQQLHQGNQGKQGTAKIVHCRELWLRFPLPQTVLTKQATAPQVSPTQAGHQMVPKFMANSGMLVGKPSQQAVLEPATKIFLQSLQARLGAPIEELAWLNAQLLAPPFQPNAPPQIVSQKKHKHLRQGLPQTLWPDALKKCILGPSTLLLHKSVCRQVGYFEPKLQIAEDYEYFLRLISRFEVAYCPDYLVAKRDSIPAPLTRSTCPTASSPANSSCVPQLSHLYPWIEPFRIEALEKLLHSPRTVRLLSPEQRQSAAAELRRKLKICLGGATKNLEQLPKGSMEWHKTRAEVNVLQEKLDKNDDTGSQKQFFE